MLDDNSEHEMALQQNSQPNQVSSIGRNSDELSEDSKEQIMSGGNYLKKDRNSQSEDSQQLTRSAFE